MRMLGAGLEPARDCSQGILSRPKTNPPQPLPMHINLTISVLSVAICCKKLFGIGGFRVVLSHLCPIFGQFMYILTPPIIHR
jgi:hypothetical protein